MGLIGTATKAVIARSDVGGHKNKVDRADLPAGPAEPASRHNFAAESDGPESTGSNQVRNGKEHLDLSTSGKSGPDVVALRNPHEPEVRVEEDSNGTRVMTINMHHSVPGVQELDDSNETEAVMEDIAARAEELDVDVLVVEEVDDDHDGEDDGVPDQFQRLGQILEAEDGAFTPTIERGEGDFSGTAVYTFNGYSVGESHNVDLVNPDAENHDRNVGVHEINRPGGGAFTLMAVHVAEKGDNKTPQQNQVADIAASLTAGEDVAYHSGLESDDNVTSPGENVISGMPTDVVMAGDFNSRESVVEEIFAGEGSSFTNVIDSPAAGDGDDDASHMNGLRIDHILTSDGITVTDTDVGAIPSNAVEEHLTEFFGDSGIYSYLENQGVEIDSVTDHFAVTADIEFGDS